MTPQLRQAIAIIKALSRDEQRQLLKVLAETIDRSSKLERQNQLFWQGHSLEELVDSQKVPIIEDITDLAGDFWEEDSKDEFLSFLREQRKSEVV